MRERLLPKRTRLRQISVGGLRQSQPVQQLCDRDMIRCRARARRCRWPRSRCARRRPYLRRGSGDRRESRGRPRHRDGRAHVAAATRWTARPGPGIGESARFAVHQADELERLRQRERRLDGARFTNGQGFGEVLLSRRRSASGESGIAPPGRGCPPRVLSSARARAPDLERTRVQCECVVELPSIQSNQPEVVHARVVSTWSRPSAASLTPMACSALLSASAVPPLPFLTRAATSRSSTRARSIDSEPYRRAARS